jgi:hypothetical protein
LHNKVSPPFASHDRLLFNELFWWLELSLPEVPYEPLAEPCAYIDENEAAAEIFKERAFSSTLPSAKESLLSEECSRPPSSTRVAKKVPAGG